MFRKNMCPPNQYFKIVWLNDIIKISCKLMLSHCLNGYGTASVVISEWSIRTLISTYRGWKLQLLMSMRNMSTLLNELAEELATQAESVFRNGAPCLFWSKYHHLCSIQPAIPWRVRRNNQIIFFSITRFDMHIHMYHINTYSCQHCSQGDLPPCAIWLSLSFSVK